jgi:hypothetical protein
VKLKVVIVDLELSSRAKQLLLRIGVPLALVLGGGTLAYAGGWTVPHQWGVGAPDGTTLTAAALNENFAALADAGAGLDLRVTTLEGVNPTTVKTYSPNAIYCGVSSAKYTGNLMPASPSAPNGYAAAKAVCETACNSTSAHMCTSEEIIRTLSIGAPFLPAPSPSGALGWYSPGVLWLDPGGNATNDCKGWTDASSNSGPVWWSSPPQPNILSCTSSLPVLCCL